MISARFRDASTKGGLLALAAFLVVGCGVADYEERMDQQRKRVAVFDDETKYLNEPIAPPMLPQAKGKSPVIAFPFEVHLRAPIFIKSKRPGLTPPKKGEKLDPTADPETDNTFAYQNLKLSWYAGEDKSFAMLVGAADLLAKNPPGKIVPNKMTADEFKGRLPGALGAYYQKTRGGRATTLQIPPLLNWTEEKVRPITSLGEGSPIMYAKAAIHENPTKETDAIGFQIYYWSDERLARQIAIIYQLPAEMIADKAEFPAKKTRTFRYSAPLVQEAIKFSLRSLGTGEDAAKKRKDYTAKKY
ncbi:MAG: hypothetical protein K2X38_11775 [Gemmataceae bacterium]|nr:hypothetical protein [Gemmataceae bacterium]